MTAIERERSDGQCGAAFFLDYFLTVKIIGRGKYVSVILLSFK